MLDLNFSLSSKLYKQLINGRVINRYRYGLSGEQEENPLFTELFTHFNEYKLQYLMSGMELVAKPDFYYVRDKDGEMPYTDAVKRVQVLLLIISRYITQRGTFEKLTNPHAGISEEDIELIAANEDFQEILNAVDMPDFAQAMQTNLLERGIMESPRQGRYVLSAAGRHFFEELFSASNEP